MPSSSARQGFAAGSTPLRLLAELLARQRTLTVFALGLLPAGVRSSPVSRGLVWTVIATARFEVAYIGVQALGWHLGGGDLRPAHFLGVHAQQLIPLAGWGLQGG